MLPKFVRAMAAPAAHAMVLCLCISACQAVRTAEGAKYMQSQRETKDAVTIVIGVCGGIASGKSTVRQSLGRLGATIIDADVLGHDAYAAGTEGFKNVTMFFEKLAIADGLEPLVDPATGEVNRKVLGTLVFDDQHPERLEKLNAIVWPIIKEKIRREIADQETTVQESSSVMERVVVVEAAVLLEALWDDVCDEVWTVDVDEATALDRLVAKACANKIESAAARQQIVEDFFALVAPDHAFVVMLMEDPWRPTSVDKTIEVLVASGEFNSTRLAASANNIGELDEARRGLPPMRLESVPLVEIPCAMFQGNSSKFAAVRVWLYGEECE